MNDACLHLRRRVSRNDQAEVLNAAMRLPGRRSDVLRPFPSWLVGGAANTHAADADDFKLPLSKVRTSSGSSNRLRITAVSIIGSRFSESMSLHDPLLISPRPPRLEGSESCS